jgi:hypothetical protein
MPLPPVLAGMLKGELIGYRRPTEAILKTHLPNTVEAVVLGS